MRGRVGIILDEKLRKLGIELYRCTVARENLRRARQKEEDKATMARVSLNQVFVSLSLSFSLPLSFSLSLFLLSSVFPCWFLCSGVSSPSLFF